MVYNRLTDFYLAEPEHAALREAYEAGGAVVSRRIRAAMRCTRTSAIWSRSVTARCWHPGAFLTPTARPAGRVPRTWLVTPEQCRRALGAPAPAFLQARGGYGAKAAYRGDKLTRRVWGEILAGCYIAQALVPPSERLSTWTASRRR